MRLIQFLKKNIKSYHHAMVIFTNHPPVISELHGLTIEPYTSI